MVKEFLKVADLIPPLCKKQLVKGPLQRILNLDFDQWAIKFAQSWTYNFKKKFKIFFSPRNLKKKKFSLDQLGDLPTGQEKFYNVKIAHARKFIPALGRMWHMAFHTNFNSTCHTWPSAGQAIRFGLAVKVQSSDFFKKFSLYNYS